MTDYYLKIDGIDGEATDPAYKDHTYIMSWSWGCTNASQMGAGIGGGARGGGSKAQFQDFHFVKPLDKGSTKLFQHCATGKHIPKIVLFCVKTASGETATKVLEVQLDDCLVSSYQSGGSSGGVELPTEQGSVTYAKVSFTYHFIDQKGAKKPDTAGYDLMKAQMV